MHRPNPSILRDDHLLRRVWEQLGRPAGCCVAGGYVRDRIIGRPSNDLDLTIAGTVHEAGFPAKRLARTLGARAHLLGTDPNRIWRIETAGSKIELWPRGGLTFEQDILRRDFRCNALSWELPDGPLIDLVGGIDDLERGRLRAITRANLADDAIRLLRGPRFLAQLTDFTLDDETRSWIEELAPSLRGAPRERIGQELLTLLRGPAASRGIAESLRLDLLGPASPAAGRVDGGWITEHLGAADTLASRHPAGGQVSLKNSPGQGARASQKGGRDCGAGVPPAGTRFDIGGDAARLAFLFRGWGTPAEGELAPYAWPKTIRENAVRAASLLDEALAAVDRPPADRRELAWLAGAAFPALLALASAVEPDHPGWRRWWRQWRRDPEVFTEPQPLLNGVEVAELTGIEPGPELGRIVRAVLRAQIRGEVRSRDGAIRWLATDLSCSGNQRR